MRTTTPRPSDTDPGSPLAGRVVADLVAAGLVAGDHAGEARAVVGRALAGAPAAEAGRGGARDGSGGARARLAEIAGYVGGALVVAAVGLFVATEWSRLSHTAQIAALAAVTGLLALAGVVAGRVAGGFAELHRGGDEVRRRLASALLVGAALAGAGTVARFAEVRSDEVSSWPAFLAGLTVVVLAAVAYRVAPSALAQLATAGGAVMAVSTGVTILAEDGGESAVVPGMAFLLLGAGWLALAEGGVFRERVVARSAGVALALFGAQLPVFDTAWLGYLATLAVAVAGFALYLRTASWPYLVAGVLGVTLVVPEAVVDWTDGSLGIAGGVLVAGLTLLGASLAGLRVRREVSQ